ncbi:MAG TPA: hypothetical protein VI074_13010, partial [Propionibacteriaceae bacterium]
GCSRFHSSVRLSREFSVGRQIDRSRTVGGERCRKRGAHARRAPVVWVEVRLRGPDTTVFRVEGSLSLPVRADTRQRLGRGEDPQADPHTNTVLGGSVGGLRF